MFSAQVKQLLDVKDVTRSSIGTSLKHKGYKLSHIFVRKHLNNFKGSFNQALLTKEEKTQTKGEDSSEAVLEVFFFFLKKDLSDAFGGILVA